MEDRHLPIMVELLGIDAPQIRTWLCNRKIVTTNEVLTKPLTITQVTHQATHHYTGNSPIHLPLHR